MLLFQKLKQNHTLIYSEVLTILKNYSRSSVDLCRDVSCDVTTHVQPNPLRSCVEHEYTSTALRLAHWEEITRRILQESFTGPSLLSSKKKMYKQRMIPLI